MSRLVRMNKRRFPDVIVGCVGVSTLGQAAEGISLEGGWLVQNPQEQEGHCVTRGLWTKTAHPVWSAEAVREVLRRGKQLRSGEIRRGA